MFYDNHIRQCLMSHIITVFVITPVYEYVRDVSMIVQM